MADLILPGGMVLLAVSLSFLLLPYEPATLTAIVGMVLAGYAGHVWMRGPSCCLATMDTRHRRSPPGPLRSHKWSRS